MASIAGDWSLTALAAASLLKALRAKGNDIIVFHIMDNFELTFPFEDMAQFEDMETKRKLHVIPEYLQNDCTPEKLSQGVREVLTQSALRQQQVDAFARLDAIMSTGNQSPSVRAAEIVLSTMRTSRMG